MMTATNTKKYFRARSLIAITTFVGPVLGHSTQHFPLYLVEATLVDARTGTRVASFQVEGTAGAAANRRDAVIAAFQQATQSAVSDTVARIRAGSEPISR